MDGENGPAEVPVPAKDVLDSITSDFPDGWADKLHEPAELPLEPIPNWDEYAFTP